MFTKNISAPRFKNMFLSFSAKKPPPQFKCKTKGHEIVEIVGEISGLSLFTDRHFTDHFFTDQCILCFGSKFTLNS